jgi:serine/threonine-protein kinase
VAGPYINLCYDQWVLANHQIRLGQDPGPTLEEGIAACRQAVAITPEDWIPHLDLGVSRSALARFQLDTGKDPMPLIAEARLDLERSLAIDSNVVTFRYVGEVEQTAARWAALQGNDAGPLFAAAEVALRKVIAADGKDADGLRRLAELQRYRAEWLLLAHRPAASVLHEGLELAGRALVLEPDLGEGHAIAGALHLVAARTASTAGEQVLEASQAQAALSLALAKNGFLKRQYGPLLEEATRLSRPE